MPINEEKFYENDFNSYDYYINNENELNNNQQFIINEIAPDEEMLAKKYDDDLFKFKIISYHIVDIKSKINEEKSEEIEKFILNIKNKCNFPMVENFVNEIWDELNQEKVIKEIIALYHKDYYGKISSKIEEILPEIIESDLSEIKAKVSGGIYRLLTPELIDSLTHDEIKKIILDVVEKCTSELSMVTLVTNRLTSDVATVVGIKQVLKMVDENKNIKDLAKIFFDSLLIQNNFENIIEATDNLVLEIKKIELDPADMNRVICILLHYYLGKDYNEVVDSCLQLYDENRIKNADHKLSEYAEKIMRNIIPYVEAMSNYKQNVTKNNKIGLTATYLREWVSYANLVISPLSSILNFSDTDQNNIENFPSETEKWENNLSNKIYSIKSEIESYDEYQILFEFYRLLQKIEWYLNAYLIVIPEKTLINDRQDVAQRIVNDYKKKFDPTFAPQNNVDYGEKIDIKREVATLLNWLNSFNDKKIGNSSVAAMINLCKKEIKKFDERIQENINQDVNIQGDIQIYSIKIQGDIQIYSKHQQDFDYEYHSKKASVMQNLDFDVTRAVINTRNTIKENSEKGKGIIRMGFMKIFNYIKQLQGKLTNIVDELRSNHKLDNAPEEIQKNGPKVFLKKAVKDYKDEIKGLRKNLTESHGPLYSRKSSKKADGEHGKSIYGFNHHQNTCKTGINQVPVTMPFIPIPIF